MAYVSPEMKAKLAPRIKEICKRYGVKASLSVHNHSTLTLTVRQGSIDFIGNMNQVCGNDHYQVSRGFRPVTGGSLDVNPYWFHEHFDGKAKKFLEEIIPALKGPDYFDHSDIQTDYFHTSHYIAVKVGRWDRPYALEK
jgi:hypothetical protein